MTEQAQYPVDKWRALHDGGMSYAKIGALYGVSPSTVYRWGSDADSARQARQAIAARREVKCEPLCGVCTIILSKSADWRYPGAVVGHVCNLCRDHYPDRAKEIDDEG